MLKQQAEREHRYFPPSPRNPPGHAHLRRHALGDARACPRSKWRARWDAALCFGGAAPALLFGVAVGNVLLGIPFYLTPDLLSIYDGPAFMKFFGLLRPFALLCGIVSLAMLVMQIMMQITILVTATTTMALTMSTMTTTMAITTTARNVR